jgi:hypothetical protein
VADLDLARLLRCMLSGAQAEMDWLELDLTLLHYRAPASGNAA